MWRTRPGRTVELCRAVGNASYAIYLIHLPAMKMILFGLILGGVNSAGLFHAAWEMKVAYIAGTLAVVVGVAFLSYEFPEKPARGIVKAWFSRRQARSGKFSAKRG